MIRNKTGMCACTTLTQHSAGGPSPQRRQILFSKFEFMMLGTYLVCSCPANKEGGLWARFGPTQPTLGLIKGMQSKVVYQHQPSITVQRVRSAHCSEGLGWKLGNCGYCSPDRAPFLAKQLEKENGAQSPTDCRSQEDLQNQPAGGFCFSRRRHYDLKLREGQRQMKKEVRRTPTVETNFTLPFIRTSMFSFSLFFFLIFFVCSF